MKYKPKLAIIFLISVVFFLLGKYLQTIYGLDPPYFLFYSGFVLEYLSIIAGIVSIVLLIYTLLKSKS
jgi:hypothetical protein